MAEHDAAIVPAPPPADDEAGDEFDDFTEPVQAEALAVFGPDDVAEDIDLVSPADRKSTCYYCRNTWAGRACEHSRLCAAGRENSPPR